MAKEMMLLFILLCLLKSGIAINEPDQPQDHNQAPSQPNSNPLDAEIEALNIDGHTIPIPDDDHAGHDYFAPVNETVESHNEQAIAQECCIEYSIHQWQESDRESNNTFLSIPSRLAQENMTMQPYRFSITPNNARNYLGQQQVSASELADPSAGRRQAEQAELQTSNEVDSGHLWLPRAHVQDQRQQARTSEQDIPVPSGTSAPVSGERDAQCLYRTDSLLTDEPAQRQQARVTEQGTPVASETPSVSTEHNTAEFLQPVEQEQLQHAQSSDQDKVVTVTCTKDGEVNYYPNTRHFSSFSQPLSEHDQLSQKAALQPGTPVETEPTQPHTTAELQDQEEDHAYKQAQAESGTQNKPAERHDTEARVQLLRRHLTRSGRVTQEDSQILEFVNQETDQRSLFQPSSEHDQLTQKAALQPGTPAETEPPQPHTAEVSRQQESATPDQERVSSNPQTQPPKEQDQGARAREGRRHRRGHNGMASAGACKVSAHDRQHLDQRHGATSRFKNENIGKNLPPQTRISSQHARQTMADLPHLDQSHAATSRSRFEIKRQELLPRTGSQYLMPRTSSQHARQTMASQIDTAGIDDELARGLQRPMDNRPSVPPQLNTSRAAIEYARYEGILHWRIPNFARSMQRAISGEETSLNSEPFYTTEGYKLAIKVYLNGKGSGANSHMSCYLILKPSEDDGLLPPFQSPVTVTLMDQETGLCDISNTIRPETGSSFQQPSEEMNIASGCPLFVPHSELNNSKYIKDDTIYLKISVNASQLKKKSGL